MVSDRLRFKSMPHQYMQGVHLAPIDRAAGIFLLSHQREGRMRKFVLTVPELAFIAATRGALGFGAGLLLSSKFDESRRRAVGVSLVAIGVATTISAARKLFSRHTEVAATS